MCLSLARGLALSLSLSLSVARYIYIYIYIYIYNHVACINKKLQEWNKIEMYFGIVGKL